MTTLFITGSAGYLGRFLLLNIKKYNFKNIICIINSEKRYKESEFLFKKCKIYKGDIKNENLIQQIFMENKIDFVIHAAAMKYIDTCEIFQKECINTNIIGTLNICRQAKKYNVKNVLTISTDKANNPSSLYGISKLASERITLSHGFSVYQGVNFWNSDGSFLQKWKTSIARNFDVILYNDKHIRFFSMPHDTANEILNLVINNNNNVNYPKKCFKLKIIDVYNILKDKFKDINFKIEYSKENNFDKIEEEINKDIIVENISLNKLKELLNNIFK